LIRIKRIDILIDAVKFIKDKYNKIINICLMGDGELKDKFIHQIKDYELENQFIFVGNQNDVDKYLLQSKVFIMTSEFEGLPQAMIEALACGLPVIMPKISNIPDYAIDGYNALLVEPLDTEGFADAIYKLLTDEKLYKKLKNGADKFRKDHEYEFSMENIKNIWNQIFNQLGLIQENNAY
jgi:glycosyltransferase involved in cell wall biosynthesis